VCLRKELIPDLPDKPKNWEGIEVSPEAWFAAQEIAQRVHATDGAALFIDYGNNGHAADTLQALKDHSHVHVLSSPGRADLTAHVDFASVTRASLDACPDVAAMVTQDVKEMKKALARSVQALKQAAEGEGPGTAGGNNAEQGATTLAANAQAAADTGCAERAASEMPPVQPVTQPRALLAHGPVTQNEFLHGLGVRERAEALFEASEDDDTRQSILKQYERLTSPEEMGALFKVLAITSDRIPAGTMPGFAVARPDLR
jgi:SAM-dependent MidA family methyltransferase